MNEHMEASLKQVCAYVLEVFFCTQVPSCAPLSLSHCTQVPFQATQALYACTSIHFSNGWPNDRLLLLECCAVSH